MNETDHTLRPHEAPKLMFAELIEADACWKRMPDEVRERAGQEHLPACGQIAEAGSSVDGFSHVAPASALHFARVYRDTGANLAGCRPTLRGHGLDDGHGCRNRVAGPLED